MDKGKKDKLKEVCNERKENWKKKYKQIESKREDNE